MGQSHRAHDDLEPLGLLLVSRGSKGYRLLFRYPLEAGREQSSAAFKVNPCVPYSTRLPDVDHPPSVASTSYSASEHDFLCGLPEDIVGHLFAVGSDLCGQQFELKLNDLRFVGFPQQVSKREGKKPTADHHDSQMVAYFTVIFVLKASASKSIVTLYQSLSKMLASALNHEETRCSYLSKQAHLMNKCIEECGREPESTASNPYALILHRSELAAHLKQIYEDVSEYGYVDLHVNSWVHLSICLPQKVLKSRRLQPRSPEQLADLLRNIRPYHAVALLDEPSDLHHSLPIDASPSIFRLLRCVTPLKNLQQLANEADLPLTQLYLVVRELVLWCKAIIIHPLSEHNVYAVSETAVFGKKEMESFSEEFNNTDLVCVLAKFSPPISLGEYLSPAQFQPARQEEALKMVFWLLKRRLLCHLHTFVHLCPCAKSCRQLLAAGSDGLDEAQVARVEQILQTDAAGCLSAEQQRVVLCICAQTQHTQPQSHWLHDLQLFASLCPYLSGEYQLEDLVYIADVRRGQLLRVLDLFRPLLQTRVAPVSLL